MAIVTINEKKYEIDVDPDMPLLWAIRDAVGLTGTKYGCGKGLCGACTVLVDGKPVRSCLTPTATVNSSQIMTIEGVHNENQVLQEVWQEIDVPQCGYCQSGQILSAAALLKENSNPTDEDIDGAMNGNICRCGTYHRIRKAIHKTAAIMNSKTE